MGLEPALPPSGRYYVEQLNTSSRSRSPDQRCDVAGHHGKLTFKTRHDVHASLNRSNCGERWLMGFVVFMKTRVR